MLNGTQHMASDYSLDHLAAFDEYDAALALERGPSPPRRDDNACRNCGATTRVYSTNGHAGAAVCDQCGAVLDEFVLFERMYGTRLTTRHSNYRRLHHAHERMSQLMLAETKIPAAHMLAIAERVQEMQLVYLDKSAVRAVLRSLKLQIYIERWLQIIQCLTDARPPRPGPQMLMQVDAIFEEMQAPFEKTKPHQRSNFLNYNYTFTRIFQKLGCNEFSCFFPLVKSKSKLQALDAMWYRICEVLDWPKEPLKPVPEFSVRIDASFLAERVTCLRRAPLETAESTTARERMERRVLNRHQVRSSWKRHKPQVRSETSAPRVRALAKRRLPRPKPASRTQSRRRV
jgi:hypothetical protein